MVTLMKSMLALNVCKASAQKFPNVLCRNIHIKSEQPPAASSESHDEKNKHLNRPLSPHLSIYQPQLTWLLSVTHRGTGVVLTAYAAGLAFASLKTGDIKSSVAAIENLGIPAPILFVFKAGIAFPFTFHCANGIRHLIWDMGQALTMKGVYTTGYIVLATSVVSAVMLAAL